MSSCVIPTTRSPGYLFLSYTHTSAGLNHTVAVHFLDGVDPADIINHRITAGNWADLVQQCLTNQFQITGWGVKLPGGLHFYDEAFTTIRTGNRTPRTGMQDARSSTVTITGKGIPGTIGECAGPTRHFLHTGAGYTFPPGAKYALASETVEMEDVASFLFSHSDIWADYYGQKAGAHTLYPVQYNAGTQRKVGT
jgi:hypothetical protein